MERKKTIFASVARTVLLVLAAAGVVLALLSDPLTSFLQAVGLNIL